MNIKLRPACCSYIYISQAASRQLNCDTTCTNCPPATGVAVAHLQLLKLGSGNDGCVVAQETCDKDAGQRLLAVGTALVLEDGAHARDAAAARFLVSTLPVGSVLQWLRTYDAAVVVRALHPSYSVRPRELIIQTAENMQKSPIDRGLRNQESTNLAVYKLSKTKTWLRAPGMTMSGKEKECFESSARAESLTQHGKMARK